MNSDKSSTNTKGMAFDPKSPSTLMLPSHDGGEDDNNLVKFFADNGISCNAEETSALMKLIDVREEYTNGEGNDDPTVLSKLYRRELVACLETWSGRLKSASQQQQHNAKVQKEDENLKLLELTHSIMHLSEIYLLRGGGGGANIMGEEDDDPTTQSNTAGIVTSDTVRYLRWNQIKDNDDILADILPEGMDLDDLLSESQPEYFQTNTVAPDGDIDENQHHSQTLESTPYWYFFRKLVLRGSLQDAWSILSNHSACRRCSGVGGDDGDDENLTGQRYVDPTLREDNEAFGLIEALLSSAPLPGGRDNSNDDGFSELVNGSSNENTRNIDDNGETLHTIVPLEAYQLWDVSMSQFQQQNRNAGWGGAPLGFNIHAAMNHYNTWKKSVAQLLKTSIPIRNLTRRIPMLQTCLWDILLPSGSSGSISFIEDDSWCERFVCELLYVRPNTRMEDMHVRALAAMNASNSAIDDNSDDENTNYTQNMEEMNIIISIMRGNAGVVVKALHEFGGGSGAALPGTLLALLCNLLVGTGQIDLSTLSYDVESELLLSAASSILSSFSEQNHSGSGVRLAAQLLQPHITPDNVQICAYVAEILEHHWPKNDGEAHTLMSICKDSISRGSRRMLDASDSLAFARYSYYKSVGNTSLSIHWLLRGIECTSNLGGLKVSSQMETIMNTICFRHLSMVCSETTTSLLNALVQYSSMEVEAQEPNRVQYFIEFATDVVHTIQKDDVAHILIAHPCITLLMNVAQISMDLIKGSYTEVAKMIYSCLEESSDETGVAMTLSHPSTYGYFLSLAFDILSMENKTSSKVEAPSFDVDGIHILMSRFSQYCSLVDSGFNVKPSCDHAHQKITSLKMNECLANALKRAFIAENSMIKKLQETRLNSSLNQTGFGTDPDLESLLGPCM